MSGKQTQLQQQTWSPTRGSHKNASESLVAAALTQLGIDWSYEDRFLPLELAGSVVRGICPDYRIAASRHWPEQFLEVTTAKKLTQKRRKARLASRLHDVPVTVVDRTDLDGIAANPWYLLALLSKN